MVLFRLTEVKLGSQQSSQPWRRRKKGRTEKNASLALASLAALLGGKENRGRRMG